MIGNRCWGRARLTPGLILTETDAEYRQRKDDDEASGDYQRGPGMTGDYLTDSVP
nr:hypothetical protein [Ferrimicrobium acidiphilum]